MVEVTYIDTTDEPVVDDVALSGDTGEDEGGDGQPRHHGGHGPQPQSSDSSGGNC